MSLRQDAVVFSKPAHCALQEIKLAELKPKQVLIRTHISGVSTGTDRWVISGRFEWGSFSFPLIPGYQRVGTVEAIGSDVSTLSVGQSVFATNSVDFLNATAGWGAHTSIGISEEHEVFDATGMNPERASFGVVAQVGFNASSRVLGGRQTRVLVIGDGIIGASAALSSRALGREVMVIGRHDSRLSKLANLGIATANARTLDISTLKDFAPSAVIDTVQNKEAFDMYRQTLPATWAQEALGARSQGTGQIIYSGHTPDGESNWGDMAELQKQELTVHFVSGWTRERMQSTLDLMRGDAMPIEALADRHEATNAGVQTLFGLVEQGKYPGLAAYINWGN